MMAFVLNFRIAFFFENLKPSFPFLDEQLGAYSLHSWNTADFGFEYFPMAIYVHKIHSYDCCIPYATDHSHLIFLNKNCRRCS
jgi:hypothetical protein